MLTLKLTDIIERTEDDSWFGVARFSVVGYGDEASVVVKNNLNCNLFSARNTRLECCI